MVNIFDWNKFERRNEDVLLLESNSRLFDVDYNKNSKTCFELAINLFIRIPTLVLSGLTNKAKEYAELGSTYIKCSKEIGDERDLGLKLDHDHFNYSLAYAQYYFEWFLAGTEDSSLLQISYNSLNAYLYKLTQKRRVEDCKELLMQLAHIAIKLNDMKLAKHIIAEINNKQKQVYGSCVIYSEQQFLLQILKYLNQDNEFQDTFRLVVNSYEEFYMKLVNCDAELFRNYKTVNKISDMSYIYHKYINSSEPHAIDPVKVIKCIRYGIMM